MSMRMCVELPLAMPTILAGVKTSAVINVGTATIAAFIGAGGYGERIVQGLALNDHTILIAGALPAAALALLGLAAAAAPEIAHGDPPEPRIHAPHVVGATPGKPFTRAGWVFELKYDGYRLLAEKHDGRVTLYSRAGNDLTATFPDVEGSQKGPTSSEDRQPTKKKDCPVCGKKMFWYPEEKAWRCPSCQYLRRI